MSWEVRVSKRFWETIAVLREKYERAEYLELIDAVRDALDELAEKGSVTVAGWDEHVLIHAPFDDGCHFEFHIHDDDTLVVYFMRTSKHTIRMIGVYGHKSIPNS